MKRKRKRDQMDGDTAIAFAADYFGSLHPQHTCPEWLPRCTSIGYIWDENGDYVVSFAFTPIVTNDAVCYFRVSIDTNDGSTRLLMDSGWAEFSGKDLYGY